MGVMECMGFGWGMYQLRKHMTTGFVGAKRALIRVRGQLLGKT
jgi:hypothetical protein